MSFKIFLELILLIFLLNGANGQLSITPSGIVDVTENSELIIECSYTGLGTYNLVNWRKNGINSYTHIASNCNRFGGQPIDPNVAEFTCTNNGKDFTLTLKTVKKEQDGERWSCSVDTDPETFSEGVTIKIKVKVTSVELQKNGVPINTDKVEVNIGVPTPFVCNIIPSISRPPPTVIWYIGLTVRQNSTSTSYTVTASEADHDQIIYCKAYNLQPENQAVESVKPKLYVRVDVASVQLQKNGLTITTAKVEVNMGVPTNPPFECNIIPSTSRPPPTVIWYIGSGVKQISNSTSYTVRASKYDHDKIFYCKAYNRPWNQAVESGKPKLYVRVKVTRLELQKNGVPINTGKVEVNIGVPTPFVCNIIPSISRPTPIVTWYIGSDVKQNSTNTSYTVTASETDHDQRIICKAYNPPLNGRVYSPAPKLYVRVKVSSVTLMDQSVTPSTGQILTFTAGTPKPLTCSSSFSRPEATIDWYIGNNRKQSSTNTTYSLNAVNADHNETVYCIGYNYVTAASERPVSYKPVLYVRVPAAVPLILNESTDDLTLLDGDPSTIQCQSTPTRPAATISWKIGNSVLSNTNTREVPEAGGLVSVISTVSLVAQHSFHNTDIICQSKINGQTGTPETRKLLRVWWRPSKPSVQTINGDFPWVESERGHLTCISANYGNPSATINWTPNVGIMNAQNQLVIDSLSYLDHKRVIKCGMENAFTKIRDEIVESEEITLNVQFSPKFLTTDVIFVGKIKENINITFSVYCNPKNAIAKLFVNGSVTNNNDKYVLMITEGVSEELNLTVTIMDLDESDFAHYSLDVTNSIDTTEVNFSVTADSIPHKPTAFRLKELRGSIAIFYWESGFNGGHKQIFLLQMRIDEEGRWRNSTIIKEHDMNSNLGNSTYIANINNLKPGTYDVRLIAMNLIGAAEPVLLGTRFTVPSTATAEAEADNSVAAIVGCVLAGVLVIIGIVAAVFIIKYLRQKGFLTKKTDESLQQEDGTDYYNMSIKEKGKEVHATRSTSNVHRYDIEILLKTEAKLLLILRDQFQENRATLGPQILSTQT